MRLSSSLHPSPFFFSFLFYSILFYSILFYSILFYSILFYSILFYSILFIFLGWRCKFGLLTKDNYPLSRTQRTKTYTASSLGQELFIQCIPYSMSHSEALTRLRLSGVINKSVLIIVSSSHLGMRKWFITPICWIIHSLVQKWHEIWALRMWTFLAW